jgi:pimeloyl-ACP methyl ester carboxylesterase
MGIFVSFQYATPPTSAGQVVSSDNAPNRHAIISLHALDNGYTGAPMTLLTKHPKLFTTIFGQSDSLSNTIELPDEANGFEKNGQSTDLVVLFHAFSKSPESLGHILDTIKGNLKYANADILAPQLPFALFSMAEPGAVIARALSLVDRACANRAAQGAEYKNIVFIGHSMGALFVRKLYIAACGENRNTPLEKEIHDELEKIGAAPLDAPRSWAHSVSRLLLMASINRGWTISHHMAPLHAISFKIGSMIGRVIFWAKKRFPIIFSTRRGAPFVTQLRLQWLEMRKHAKNKGGIGKAITVQLLGSIDDLVSPDDNIDLVTGKDFIYLDVPASGHKNIIDMGHNTPEGRARREVLDSALSQSAKELKDIQVIPFDTRIQANKRVTDVIFVIHGIRDEGFWTRKIARRIASKGNERKRIIRSVTSSYGYFPMLSFFRPGARQAKVEWLMDQYTEAKARYPNAQFSYVGHSNGTYLLTKALQDYPAVKFERVVFAGSVVNIGYKWEQYTPGRVGAVLNFRADADWVVAFFPKALQSLQIQDLGSAGHDGFNSASTVNQVFQPDLLVSGGHSTALQEKLWEEIAEFVLVDTPTHKSIQLPVDIESSSDHKSWVKYPAYVAPVIWVAIIAILVWILHLILNADMAEWLKTVSVLAYLLAIWTVLTRV